MTIYSVERMRTRAELARLLSLQVEEPEAVAALQEIAETLDAEADDLERNVIPMNGTARR